MEGLIFRGAYVQREICVIKLVGLACSGKEIYHFCFVLLCIRGQIPSTSPWGAYIWRGDLTEGFCVTGLGGLYLEGLIHGGAYFWNLTLVWSSAHLGQHIVFQWLIPRRVVTSLMAAVIHFRIFIDFRKGSCTQGHVCFTIGPGDSPSKMHIYGAASHGFTVTLVALTPCQRTTCVFCLRLLIGYSQLT